MVGVGVLFCGRCAGEYTDEKYDMYYLKDRVNIEKLRQVLQIYVFDDDFMREKNGKDITKRLKTIFADKVYIARLVNSDKKWIDADVCKITAGLVELAEKNIRDIMFHCVTPSCRVESDVAGRYRSGSASPGSVSFSAGMLRHGCQDCTYQYPRRSEMA